MKKLILVFVLLLSMTVPVFSEEPSKIDTEDQELGVVVIDPETTTKEETDKEEPKPEIKPEEPEKEDVVNKLMISKKTYELEVNLSRQINYKTEGGKKVTFKSLDPKIVTVDDSGFMSTISAGKTKIKVIFTPDKGDVIEDEILVNVFELEEEGQIFFKENEFYLIRDLYFDVDYSLEGAISSGELIWESSKPTVALVENGQVLGQSLGSAVITASAGDASASMTVYVTAPLKGLAYNLDKIEMILGEEKELPSLVYAPYDTTSDKNPEITIENPEIAEIDNNTIIAKKVGETKVSAKINDISAELTVIIRPEKNKNGANIITLQTESEQEGQITFKTPDLSLYEQELYSVNLPLEETLNFIEKNDDADIFIVLNSSLYAGDMNKLDELMVDKEIMEQLDGKNIRIHLLNQNNNPMIVYEFNNGMNASLNLKYSVKKIKESNPLFSLVNTMAYHASFANKEGFPAQTIAKIPAQATDSHYKQLHFVYQVENKNLLDTNQELSIDAQDYLNVELEGNSYLITLSKVSSVNDSNVIVTLSVVLFITLISGISFYYYKAHYLNKKV